MKIKQTAILFLSIFSTLTLSACAHNATATNVYSNAQSGLMQDVQIAEVVSIRKIIIEQSPKGTGQTAGGLIGALAGSEVGKGKGQIVGGVLGAIASGVVGSIVDRNAQAQPGVEITLKLKSDRTVAIVQPVGEVFEPGEKVKVLTSKNGEVRVTH